MLTCAQIREVDRLAIERLGIPGIVLMENAGRNAAELVARFAEERQAKRFFVFCGGGNNGGDGFVIARHLLNRGLAVVPFLAGGAAKLSTDCATNYRIVSAMGVHVGVIDDSRSLSTAVASIGPDDVVVDALLGTGFSGRVRPPLDELIRALNASRNAGVVAIDVPSGLDCDTGTVTNVAVRAALTVTFVAAKVGFKSPAAAEWVGEYRIVEIGIPPSLVGEVANVTPQKCTDLF